MLKTAGLSKTFKNAAEPALSDINLEIEEGEFICIVGPSGCGKSTLLNLIAGLETPTSGSIILDDKEVKGPGADRVVMFQEPALYPWLNVQRANRKKERRNISEWCTCGISESMRFMSFPAA